MHFNRLDLSKVRFGKLVVVKPLVNLGHGTRWYCLCDCGNYKTTTTRNLRAGKTKSCGCLYVGHPTHGMAYTRIYHVWAGMKRRCNYPFTMNYHHYGGRGVLVCKQWRESFIQFYKDMGDPPSDKHEIDRIDNEGNYEPGNCRWVTHRENMRNTRRRHV